MTSRYAAVVMALVLGAGLAPVRAEYPERAVTVVVPFPPGGGTDVYARMLAEELRDKLKQTFVVENRAGASM
jgi:tripartite-type tricarboxylate transporter receptor subunit TctC